MRPQGRAILDYHQGDTAAYYIMHSDDGEQLIVPASLYFRTRLEWPEIEGMAVDQCRGRVLDVGAGAGCHSLVLQELGLGVCAIDVSAEAVRVIKERGIKDVHLVDLADFQAEPFDTILMLMNGIGLVGTLIGLEEFLGRIHRLLKPGGQIIFDSFDARHDLEAPIFGRTINLNDSQPYFGEVSLHLEYKGEIGPLFAWLYVDEQTLTQYAKNSGWSCTVLHRTGEGPFLARLAR